MKSKVLSVRILDEQLVELKGAALVGRKKLSRFVLEAALKAARRMGRSRRETERPA